MHVIIVESSGPDPQERLSELAARIRIEAAGRPVALPVTGDPACAVAAVLLSRALGMGLTCVYLDAGVGRGGEAELLNALVSPAGARLLRIDATEAVLTALEGVTDGPKKRDIVLSLGARYTAGALAGMGPSLLLAGAACLNEQRGAMVAQALKAREVLAPLAGLTRAEAARLGVVLGMPRSLALSQPFPEDGLVRRMDGPVTGERLELLRHADGLFRAEVERSRARPARYFAALSADDSVLLRVFDGNGAPTGLPWRTAAAAALRIQAECGVDRVSYDLTPATQPEQNWF